jgi:hypothetical protein
VPGTFEFHENPFESGFTTKWYAAMAIRPPAKAAAKVTRLFFIRFEI